MRKPAVIILVVLLTLGAVPCGYADPGTTSHPANPGYSKELCHALVALLSLVTVGIAVAGLALYRNHRKLRAQTGELEHLHELRNAFFDADPRMIGLKDENFKYILANRALQDFYGKQHKEIIGRDDFALSDPKFATARRAHDKEVLAKNTRIIHRFEKGNHLYETTKFPVRLRHGRTGVGTYIKDITEPHRHESRRQRNQMRNALLVDIMGKSFATVHEQLDYVLHKALALTGSRYGYIYLYDEQTGELRNNSWSKDVMPDCRIVKKQTVYQLEHTGIWGEVVRRRKPLVINDFEAPHPLKKGYPAGHVRLKRFMSVPVIIDGQIVAVVGLANKEPPYDDEDVSQITVLMNVVWHVKERKTHMNALEQANRALKKKEDELRHISYHDALTGLYNRRFFEEELRRLDTPRNLPTSVILGDMNGLKLANDVFGHATGDLLLQKLARTLKRVCRADDITARWGGDEFAVLLPRTGPPTAEQVCTRIREGFARECLGPICGSIALGCDTKTGENQDIREVLQRAEHKMYAEKTLHGGDFDRQAVDRVIEILLEKPEEKQHAVNVRSIADLVGETLQLPPAEQAQLHDAAFVHDIGKVAMKGPDQPRLRQHANIGYRILNFAADTVDLAEPVLYHHERWDGTGHPKGLRGEEIPLLARIIAVADHYDLLTRGAAGRQPRSKEEALREIEARAGTWFDPALTEALSRALENR